MAPQVAGLEVGMRAVLENAKTMSSRDWRVVPLNWNESLYKPGRKLRIGYYEDDGIFPATPGAKRALRVKYLHYIRKHVEAIKLFQRKLSSF